MQPADTAERRREIESLRADLARLDAQHRRAGTARGRRRGATPARPPVQPRRNVERFRPIEARFVRFTVAATTDGTEPCIDELEVYGPDAPADNLALASRAKATASSVYPNNPLHTIEHLNDGRFGNGRSWISNERGKGWVQMELPKAATIDRVVWGRDREQKYRDRLARDYRIEVSTDGDKWTAVAGSWDRLPFGHGAVARRTTLARPARPSASRLEERLASLEKPMMIYAGTFRKPDPTFVLKRGDPTQKLQEVRPAGVRAVAPVFELQAGCAESERRLALADWIASPDNPLPARVMVNRVWHWHFGQGIVRTPSDFGFNGDRPSHPELLDWLAAEYQANGWKLKPLHRLIVLSSRLPPVHAFDDKAAAAGRRRPAAVAAAAATAGGGGDPRRHAGRRAAPSTRSAAGRDINCGNTPAM